MVELQRFTKPMRKEGRAMFKRGAEALGDIAARIRGKRKTRRKTNGSALKRNEVEQALPAQGTTAPRSSALKLNGSSLPLSLANRLCSRQDRFSPRDVASARTSSSRSAFSSGRSAPDAATI